MTDAFSPIVARHTVQDAVFQQLRQALMAGRYDPGQRLTISQLADAFGVSHMPVREALRRLVAEGALQQGANGAVTVPAVHPARLEDLTRVRLALEGLAAEMAAAHATPEAIREAERLRKHHKAAGAREGAYESLARNRAFHFALYRASGSDVLPQMIEELWLRYGPYMRLLSHHLGTTIGTDAFRNGASHHAEAMAALTRRDPAGLRRAIEADLSDTYEMLRLLVPASPPSLRTGAAG